MRIEPKLNRDQFRKACWDLFQNSMTKVDGNEAEAMQYCWDQIRYSATEYANDFGYVFDQTEAE